jgi:hypothetical protein
MVVTASHINEPGARQVLPTVEDLMSPEQHIALAEALVRQAVRQIERAVSKLSAQHDERGLLALYFTAGKLEGRIYTVGETAYVASEKEAQRCPYCSMPSAGGVYCDACAVQADAENAAEGR